MKTISKENYLKIIFSREEETGKPITTTFLADKLNVSKAAITDMARRLAAEDLIAYERYHGIRTLPKGKKLAVEVIRKHRLWELFLLEVLNMNWSEVHDEAELLEHTTSDKLMNRIDKFLGHPKFDPHGDPIPNRNGKFPKTAKRMNLLESVEGKKYKIVRVNDASKDVIDFLSEIGIKLGSEITVKKILPKKEGVLIKNGRRLHSISGNIAAALFIAPLEKGGKI